MLPIGIAGGYHRSNSRPWKRERFTATGKLGRALRCKLANYGMATMAPCTRSGL